MNGPLLTTIETSQAEIVDLVGLRPEHLENLWAEEKRLWQGELFWDTTPAISVIRDAVKRRRLAGSAIRIGDEVVGCGYYIVDGKRAVLGGFMLVPEARVRTIGLPLARSLIVSVQSAQAEGAVTRVESQFITFGLPWLREAFLTEGFREHDRAFLRLPLQASASSCSGSRLFEFTPWSSSYLSRTALLMHQAHDGRVDAEMNELYRNPEGCRTLLENILQLQGCGEPIPMASSVAQRPESRMLSGFIVATEISPRHAHLAQVAVSPSAQGLGLGKLLLGRAIDALTRAGYRTVSLMVTKTNERALSLYESMGFRTVLRFPVFSWDRQGPQAL
jgi:ribosomal protein S18 acetylase RimI-like enzyme